jgi:xanthine dehydrogenase YagS FAD-binding subunit
MLSSFSYAQPTTIGEAVKLSSAPNARITAGGTDLLGCLRDHVLQADKVVSLSKIAELRGISPAANGGLRVGALATIAEIAANSQIVQRYAALSQAAAVVASPQLRNQGTLGGNLCQRPRCWYFRGEFNCARKGGDTCFAMEGENQYHCLFGGSACFIVHPSDTAPALLALGASVRIAGPRGTRTVPIAQFFMPPAQNIRKENVLEASEIVTEVLLPAPPANLRSSYRKVRGRGSWDFALAGVALAVVKSSDKVESIRMVLSGAAPIPWRVEAAEKTLTGNRLDAATAAAAADAALKGAEPLAQNGYKVPLFKGLIKEALLALA